MPKPIGSSDLPPTFVFIDESGNFDFTGKGSDHFVVSAFITTDPLECGKLLHSLTYDFLARDLSDQIPFHASENSRGTRRRVVATLCPSEHICSVQTIYADKHLAHPDHHQPEVFYSHIGGAMGKLLVERLSATIAPIVMLIDSLLTSKQQRAFLKAVKPILNQFGVPYVITFRPVKHDVNGQIADYYAWSTFRSLEYEDDSWLKQLPGEHVMHNLFIEETTRYW